jgi:hypothetical protein
MANTRKLKRKNNKSRRKYLKKRGGNADVSNLFMNSNPLVRISQMAGLTR